MKSKPIQMKHLYEYQIIENYLKEIESVNTLNELELLEESLKKVDEGKLYKFVKSKIKKLKTFFKDLGKSIEYILTGYDPDDKTTQKVKKQKLPEEILLIYKEPRGAKDDVYVVHNGHNATNTSKSFSSIFKTYNKRNLKGDLKSLKHLRISKSVLNEFPYRVEYIITIYALLDEVDSNLYGFSHGAMEDVTPSIRIHLKDIKPDFTEKLRKHYLQLLELPNFYDNKTETEFNAKVLEDVIQTINYDLYNQAQKQKRNN